MRTLEEKIHPKVLCFHPKVATSKNREEGGIHPAAPSGWYLGSIKGQSAVTFWKNYNMKELHPTWMDGLLDCFHRYEWWQALLSSPLLEVSLWVPTDNCDCNRHCINKVDLNHPIAAPLSHKLPNSSEKAEITREDVGLFALPSYMDWKRSEHFEFDFGSTVNPHLNSTGPAGTPPPSAGNAFRVPCYVVAYCSWITSQQDSCCCVLKCSLFTFQATLYRDDRLDYTLNLDESISFLGKKKKKT